MLRDNSSAYLSKDFGIAPPRVGEGDLDLTHQPARLTFHAWDGKAHVRPSAADGQRQEAALDLAPRDDLASNRKLNSGRFRALGKW